MNQKQTITDYVIKEITNHLSKSGESISSLAKRCQISSSTLHAFTLGVGTITLKTADKIIKAINSKK